MQRRLGTPAGVLIRAASEISSKIDDETLGTKASSSIFLRTLCGLELNVRKKGQDEVPEEENPG